MANFTSLHDRRKQRNRSSLKKKSKGMLRLSVFRSSKHIYGQVIHIEKGLTILSCSSIDNDMSDDLKKNKSGKIEISKLVAKKLSDKMKKNKIVDITFDRNGYRYHGRIKAFAEELRNNGIKF